MIEPADAAPPRLAPLWRRAVAAAIDVLILSLAGNLIAALYRKELVALGQSGRIVGLLLVGIYLGGLNSFLTNGQTPGKKLARLRVVDAQGELLSRQLALLRSWILALPLLTQGIYIGTASPSVALTLTGLLSLISVGAGGALLYLYVFNRGTGQSLHDWLVGSYVVVASQPRGPIAARMWRGHLVVLALWLGAAAILGPTLWWNWSGGFDWQRMFSTQQSLQSQLQEARVAVMRGVFHPYATGADSPAMIRYLQVSVVYPRRIDDFAAAADTVAAVVLRHSAIEEIDELRITVSYGFDILIASRYWAESFIHTPEQWQQRWREGGPQPPDTRA